MTFAAAAAFFCLTAAALRLSRKSGAEMEAAFPAFIFCIIGAVVALVVLIGAGLVGVAK